MKSIYEPREDSFLLAKHVEKLAKGNVLDVGCGSGIQGQHALKNPNVKSLVGLDINPDAIQYCKMKIKKGMFFESNLFSFLEKNRVDFSKGETFPIESSMRKTYFDTIIFNPPYLPAEPSEAKESALYTSGGTEGYELLLKFLKEARTYLAIGGVILIVFSSQTNKEKVEEAIKADKLQFEKLDEESLFMEKLFVYKIYASLVPDAF